MVHIGPVEGFYEIVAEVLAMGRPAPPYTMISAASKFRTGKRSAAALDRLVLAKGRRKLFGCG